MLCEKAKCETKVEAGRPINRILGLMREVQTKEFANGLTMWHERKRGVKDD